MIIAISQPTFLPWSGYIALIDYVHEFIFLDNVQFDKRSWQQRNNIKTSEGTQTITIPVHSKNLFNQKINEVQIDYSSNFLNKIIKTIEQNYSKSLYFNNYSKELFEIFLYKHEKIVDLNISLIRWICEKIDIKFKFSLSSELNLKSTKEDLIKEICIKKNAKKYVSTLGAKKYLKNKNFLKGAKTELFFFKYLNKEYKQLYDNFTPNLSIIDLLFNLGPKSKEILRKNFIIS